MILIVLDAPQVHANSNDVTNQYLTLQSTPNVFDALTDVIYIYTKQIWNVSYPLWGWEKQ